jgi:hypothetical protein
VTTALPMWLQWVWALAGLAAFLASGIALYQAWQARRDLRHLTRLFDEMMVDGSLEKTLAAVRAIPEKLDKMTSPRSAAPGDVDVPVNETIGKAGGHKPIKI